MIEGQKLRGLQDRNLELGRKKNWREKVTPTNPEDPGIKRARLYRGLVEGVVVASMAYEGMLDGRGTPEMIEEQTTIIRTKRREAVLEGFNLRVFDTIVKDTITLLKRKEEEKEADWKLINEEFPGQFEDWEKQAFMGDVPPRNDAGGFEMKRRGW